MFLDGGNPLYTNIYYEGVGHMGLCDLSIASPLLSAVLSGGFQKADAYGQLELLNEDCLNWLDALKTARSWNSAGRMWVTNGMIRAPITCPFIR